MENKIHAMVPARFGSTRLKLKNLCLIDGKPMISYAIDAAVKSGKFDKVSINSDHPIFREIASKCRIDFYQRDAYLGSSDTKSDDVVMDYFNNHSDADILVWVNSISPFQTASEVQDVINYFIENELDSLITVEDKQVHCDFEGKPVNYEKEGLFEQTQDLTPVNPFVYSIMMWRRSAFMDEYKNKGHALFCGKFGTYAVDKMSGIIIKTEQDLMMADLMMRALNQDGFKYQLEYDPVVKADD